LDSFQVSARPPRDTVPVLVIKRERLSFSPFSGRGFLLFGRFLVSRSFLPGSIWDENLRGRGLFFYVRGIAVAFFFFGRDRFLFSALLLCSGPPLQSSLQR